MTVVATVGAAYSANKGAASMLQALFDRLPEALGPCRFEVLSTHPGADAAELPAGVDVRVRSSRPVAMVTTMLPLALVAGALRVLGLPTRPVLLTPALRALASADVVVDVTGISYASGRGFPRLVYNVVNTVVPRLLGRPVVMASQAMGPFDDPVVRLAARALLPDVAAICARGASTREHLDGLGLTNVIDAADLAFLMDVSDDDRRVARMLLEEHGIVGDYVVVAPSSVVDRYSERTGSDYVGAMAALVDDIAERTGLPVVLVPHAVQPGMQRGTLNDRPVCRDIVERACCAGAATVIDRSLAPGVLRAVIEGSTFVVTSRFHAMISALSCGRPMLVVGWSHKYVEVADEFGLGDQVIPFDGVTVDDLCRAWRRSNSSRDELAAAAVGGRAAAQSSARRSIEAIRSVMDGAR